MKNGNQSKYDVLLLFPPNWSACVNSPHLGLPLISGSLKNAGFEVETIDLSILFYNQFKNKPDLNILESACKNLDFNILNKLYFDWQNPFEKIASNFNCDFGLISGFTGGNISSYELSELFMITGNNTPFTQFYQFTLYNLISQKEPEFIGVSIASYNQFIAGVELIQFINKEFRSIKIILGGNFITRIKDIPDFNLILEFVDCIILYQGEIEFLKYIQSYSKKGEIEKKIVLSQKVNLDDWNTPNFKGINLDSYPGKMHLLPIVFSRGCYYNKCSFCTIPMGWSKNGFAGSNDSVFILKQIKELISLYGVRNFKIIDESFISNRIFDFLNFNLEFYWEAYVRVEKFWENFDNVKSAFNAGCRKLYFGLEQAPGTNTKYLNKNNTGNIYKILENCKKIGIQIHIFTLIGYPGTKIRDAEKTTEFLLDNSELIDTADISGFRMERVVDNEFVKIVRKKASLKLNYDFTKIDKYAIDNSEIKKTEHQIIDYIWENEPKLIHPLYRIGLTWD